MKNFEFIFSNNKFLVSIYYTNPIMVRCEKLNMPFISSGIIGWCYFENKKLVIKDFTFAKNKSKEFFEDYCGLLEEIEKMVIRIDNLGSFE
jgi:hypothetical protein